MSNIFWVHIVILLLNIREPIPSLEWALQRHFFFSIAVAASPSV